MHQLILNKYKLPASQFSLSLFNLTVKGAQMLLRCGEGLNVISWNDTLPEAVITGASESAELSGQTRNMSNFFTK